MNVVLLPAIASSLASAVSDGVFCDQWTCLFGWAWSFAALTLAAVWFLNRWQSGSDSVAGRLQPAGVTVLVPQRADLASPTSESRARPRASAAVAAGLALRG